MTNDLFEANEPGSTDTDHGYQPLAARMRPDALDGYVGQQHLLATGKPLRQAIDNRQLHSMILWGPPGVGKTTLARIAAEHANAQFIQLSAVLSGVKDIRDAIHVARQQKSLGRDTVLFVDEVHRFNKSQQDAFLPHVEDGTIIFIGATTENPSFELNNALLSRARVYKLRPLESVDVEGVLRCGLAMLGDVFSADSVCLARIAREADGDARRGLNLLELASDLSQDGRITQATLDEVLQASLRRFDKGGDLFYDHISALHKAVRGSSPDGALYWFCRMLDGGCDPLYVARRLVRMASEDIGNADPRALSLALDAWQVQERLGSPEGELSIAQALLYLACAPKSNAVYSGYGRALSDAAELPGYEVPLHIRNAPTALMKEMGHGDDYRYAHNFDDGFVAGESYMPQELDDKTYYEPVNRGLEIQIREKLEKLHLANEQSDFKRYPKD